jgi:hyperosmotically inducible protein
MRLKRSVVRLLTPMAAIAATLSVAPSHALDTRLHRGDLIFVADNSSSAQRGGGAEHGNSSQPVADSVVTMKVKAALAATKGLESRHVSVKTVNGTVNLSGSIPSEQQRAQALKTVRDIEGVSSVSDGLTVGGKS